MKKLKLRRDKMTSMLKAHREAKAQEEKNKTHTILVVDDEPYNLESFKGALSSDYHVLVAADGQAALDLLKKDDTFETVSLILSDQRMPNMTGMQLFEATMALMPKVQRILITGYADLEAVVGTVEYPAAEEQFRFCTEALVRGDDLPSQKAAREVLRDFGDSLIVIRSEDVLKVHIHTDDPEEVFTYLRSLGTLATHKAEDMEAQHQTVGRAADHNVKLARRPLTIVTDSAEEHEKLSEGVRKDIVAVVVSLPDGERLVVLRADGRSIYATRDLGAIQVRDDLAGGSASEGGAA